MFSLLETLRWIKIEYILCTKVLHVCGQIDIVRQKLSEITRKNVKQDVNENIVKMIITRHQRIISLSKNIEAFFSNITFIQFLSDTFSIGCVGFLIVIVSIHKTI